MTRREFTPQEIRFMEVQRERGRTYADIAYDLGCATSFVQRVLTGQSKKYKPKKIRPARKYKRSSIVDRPTPNTSAPRHCNITCCNDRKSCQDIDHPQECLVWRLYNDKKKQSLPKESITKKLSRRKVKK